MKTSMIISNDSRTMTRMAVIARRTGSELMAGAKALRSGRWVQQPSRGYDMKTTRASQVITVNEVGGLI